MTLTSRLGRQIAEDITYLTTSWPLLVELGVPEVHTTSRVASSLRVQSEAASERAAAEALVDALEAAKPGYVRPGKHPVPIDATLLDLMARVVHVVSDVAETVTQHAGAEHRPSPGSIWQDARPYLAVTQFLLEAACDASDDVAPWVAHELHALAGAVAMHLAEVRDGQVIDALCPWCMGRTAAHPTGGGRTLVVYSRASLVAEAAREAAATAWAAKVAATVDDPTPASDRAQGVEREPLVVCRGTSCTPPDSDVGVWLGTDPARPAWPLREWAWLSKRLVALPELVRA